MTQGHTSVNNDQRNYTEIEMFVWQSSHCYSDTACLPAHLKLEMTIHLEDCSTDIEWR